MPGFVSAVQPSVKVPIVLTHLYYICFLSGFVISAAVYCLLHFLFPAVALKDFVAESGSPKHIMKEYRDRWNGGIVEASVMDKTGMAKSRELDLS
jgi:NCS1 family nucleobase:cation symporter-1